MARKSGRSVSLERIVEAALKIADEVGLDDLTIRNIAGELGVGTMTLYGYVRSKDEILDAMADHVLGGIRMPEADPADPGAVLRAAATGFLAMMREHPSIVQLMTSRVTMSMHSMEGGLEGVLSRFLEAGIPPETAVRCYSFLITYALGFAGYQHPRPWGHSGGEEVEELRRQRKHFYASLPASKFPSIVAIADHLVDLPADAQYDFGVDCFIASVVATLPERTA
ncbi:TetR/AcrR family transcriptional regulator [Actinocorallia sp. A-T 12471]|uniref:TetR/AcrR family transcriptional regulator n=1 Tax=Actinocorallia sp. A-T 12471 TaxID=3089813 RepID=UPI0029CE88F3|nr:TetR/AcrR family transcriptional regulator [Actinocorallia sp. A-T 12471]MDX6741082.1 TetR/AcrR family transcriptional regulator [Actinocorallia sp. A-T 12471]